MFVTPRFDLSLPVVAWADDEVAGFTLYYPKRMGDWGWISVLGVAPAWRRQGLGLALLQESFRRIRATGETVAALGVDSENPTGATRLYERAGMRVLWQADVWREGARAGWLSSAFASWRPPWRTPGRIADGDQHPLARARRGDRGVRGRRRDLVLRSRTSTPRRT